MALSVVPPPFSRSATPFFGPFLEALGNAQSAHPCTHLNLLLLPCLFHHRTQDAFLEEEKKKGIIRARMTGSGRNRKLGPIDLRGSQAAQHVLESAKQNLIFLNETDMTDGKQAELEDRARVMAIPVETLKAFDSYIKEWGEGKEAIKNLHDKHDVGKPLDAYVDLRARAEKFRELKDANKSKEQVRALLMATKEELDIAKGMKTRLQDNEKRIKTEIRDLEKRITEGYRRIAGLASLSKAEEQLEVKVEVRDLTYQRDHQRREEERVRQRIADLDLQIKDYEKGIAEGEMMLKGKHPRQEDDDGASAEGGGGATAADICVIS